MLKLIARLLGRREPGSPGAVPKQNPFPELREKALRISRDMVGIPTPPVDEPVWGVVVEWYMATEVVLLTLSDGSSSMYFGYGGGVIGGQAHESVRRAGAKLLALANANRHRAAVSASLALPDRKHFRFRLLTDAGVLDIDAPERDVRSQSSPLHDLFVASHEFFASMRKQVR